MEKTLRWRSNDTKKKLMWTIYGVNLQSNITLKHYLVHVVSGPVD